MPGILNYLRELEGKVQYFKDKAEGWEAECRLAVEVAYARGAVDWAEKNYPQWTCWLRENQKAKREQSEMNDIRSEIKAIHEGLDKISETYRKMQGDR